MCWRMDLQDSQINGPYWTYQRCDAHYWLTALIKNSIQPIALRSGSMLLFRSSVINHACVHEMQKIQVIACTPPPVRAHQCPVSSQSSCLKVSQRERSCWINVMQRDVSCSFRRPAITQTKEPDPNRTPLRAAERTCRPS